jgi:hypothetical protein
VHILLIRSDGDGSYVNCNYGDHIALLNKQQLDKIEILYVISGFRREVAKNCTLLGCYAASSSGNFLPTFRDNLSVPF